MVDFIGPGMVGRGCTLAWYGSSCMAWQYHWITPSSSAVSAEINCHVAQSMNLRMWVCLSERKDKSGKVEVVFCQCDYIFTGSNRAQSSLGDRQTGDNRASVRYQTTGPSAGVQLDKFVRPHSNQIKFYGESRCESLVLGSWFVSNSSTCFHHSQQVCRVGQFEAFSNMMETWDFWTSI